MSILEKIASCIKGGSTFDQEDRMDMAVEIAEVFRKNLQVKQEATSFQMLMDAYIRGYHWRGENPDSEEYLPKAAYDYADKSYVPGTTFDHIANQAAHVRLGLLTRQDVTAATKILVDMVEEFVDGARS